MKKKFLSDKKRDPIKYVIFQWIRPLRVKNQFILHPYLKQLKTKDYHLS